MSEPTASEIDSLMAELEAELEGLDETPKPKEPQPKPEDEGSDLDIAPPAQTGATPEIAPAASPAPVAVAASPSEPPTGAQLRKQASAQASSDADELAALKAELEAPAVAATGKPGAASGPAVSAAAESALTKPAPEPALSVPTPPVLVAVPPAAPSPITASGFTEEEIADPVSKAKTVKPTLNYYVDVEAFKRETAVSDTNLDECMIQQPGLRAYYGAQAAQAEAQHARLKARFDVLEAKLYDTHRKALAATGEKVTEKAVENAVKLDPQWLKAKNAVIEAETIANVNRSLVASLSDRVSMLMQLGADRREEFKLAGGVRTTVSPAESKAPGLAARALAKAQQAAA